MIRLLRAAIRGVRQELAEGTSGWVSLSGNAAPLPSVGAVSKSGQTVSAESAMSLSTVWSCVRTNAQLVGSLPIAMFERQADGGKTRIDHELSQILCISPSAGQTATEFWEGNCVQQMLRGNGYSEKLFVGPRLVGLRPLFNVVPKARADGRFEYTVTERGASYILPPEKVFHIRGFGTGDGMGLSAIKYGVQSIGSAISADETSASMFANGLMASGVLKSDQVLKPDQRTALQNMLSTFVSSKSAGKILTLEAGLQYQQLQINPEDAQLLEARAFQVEDICRWFGTPPVVIGHAGAGQTMWGTGVEAIMLAWLTLGINPLLRRMESRIARDLIPPEKRGKWFFEWNREAMLQMDSKAKGEFLSKMTAGGIMSSDEARDKLNLPRRGGAADDLRAQTALAPLEDLNRSVQ